MQMRASLHASLILRNEDDNPQGVLESPLKPMYPDRQPPHVLAVVLHSCLFNSVQWTVMLEQSTAFTVDRVASTILTALDGLNAARSRCMDLSMESIVLALKLPLEPSCLLLVGGDTPMETVALELLS